MQINRLLVVGRAGRWGQGAWAVYNNEVASDKDGMQSKWIEEVVDGLETNHSRRVVRGVVGARR